ncbi:MAG TPA: cupin domain-containing protein [Solirubrobacteraceae bacterium]|jgi:mannose-6-phosphate isomerase-like protein (cupin superfamily)
MPTTTARTIYNPVQRDWATFIETSEESGGTRTLIEVEVAPGGGNEPHRHLTYAERFEVREGMLMVRVGDESHGLAPGESATAEAGVLHCFRNTTEAPVRFLVELRPGHRGFERALQAGYGLAEDGRVTAASIPRNPLHVAVLMEWSEMRVTGPIRLAVPLLKLLARVARGRGIDRELEAKYVRF